MDNNIRYIRWAATTLKVVIVINLILGLLAFIATFVFPVAAAVNGNVPATGFGLVINFGALVILIINAFITYTAARGLELLADIAHHLLMTWQQNKQP